MRNESTLTRRQLLKLGLCGGLAAGVGGGLASCGRRTRYQGPVRHVIFISLDTARPDHFGCYEDTAIQTPHIDALARESILFSDHVTPVTTTLSSHTSMFTGKYPHTHGVPRNGFVVNTENVLLPQILKDVGFHTAGFLGAFSLHSRFGLARGFDHYSEDFDILQFDDNDADQNQRRAENVTKAVTDYLDGIALPDNLFLFVHYFDPHKPYLPPSPYDAMYKRGEKGSASPLANHPILGQSRRPSKLEEQILRYGGEITYTDAAVGLLLEDLRQRGILDDALLILTSDHGEHLSDARTGLAFDHGWTVYQVEIRALLAIRLPGAHLGGSRNNGLTSHIDILPTLTDYLGVPTPAGVEGQVLNLNDLKPPGDTRMVFSEASKPWEKVETDPRWYNFRKERCVRTKRYKYVQQIYRDVERLFDLSSDPREKNNLLRDPTQPQIEIAAELKNALQAWAIAASPLPTQFEPIQRDDTSERLRSLGYLE